MTQTKTARPTKIRPLGDILLEMEPLIQEAMDSHDLQWGDMLGLIHHYLMIHYPSAQEKYDDGTYPVYAYGHIDYLKKFLLIGKKKKVKSDKKRKRR